MNLTSRPKTIDVSRELEWTDELIEEFWAYQAKYRSEDYFTYQFSDQILKATLKYVKNDSTVCDYGCGSGYLLEKILENFKASGYEYTQENILIAKERLQNEPNYLGLFSIEEISNSSRQFDVIYLVETIEHVTDDGFVRLVGNLRTLLRDNGLLIVTTPNNEDLMKETVYCPCCKNAFHRWQHLRSFDGDSLSNLMSSNGFKLVDLRTLDFSANTFIKRIKVMLSILLKRKLPHLLYVGRKL